MTKYFGVPFANTGDQTSIPDALQPGGDVSFEQGYTPDYEKDQATDPAAKDVPRQSENYFKFVVTEALKELQENGYKIYSADVNYPLKAYALASDGRIYKCLVLNGPDTSVVDPVGNPAEWFDVFSAVNILFDDSGVPFTAANLQVAIEELNDSAIVIASTAEAQAGTVDTKSISPLKLYEVFTEAGSNWGGIAYVDPDAVGANPTAKIYPDGTISGSTDNGSYVKYPNGFLEIRGMYAAQGLPLNVSNAADTLLTLPVELISISLGKVGVGAAFGRGAKTPVGETGVYSIGLTSIGIYKTGADGIDKGDIIVTGEWK